MLLLKHLKGDYMKKSLREQKCPKMKGVPLVTGSAVSLEEPKHKLRKNFQRGEKHQHRGRVMAKMIKTEKQKQKNKPVLRR